MIADIKRIFLLNDSDVLKFFLFFSTLSKNLSDNNTNIPPETNPIDGINHCIYPNSKDKSIAGKINDQNDAAIITPALNPKTVSNIFLLTSLKKHTTKEPDAVIPHVNIVAINA